MSKRCIRCNDTEFRIDGYCSIYCQDMHEVELELAEARRLLKVTLREVKYLSSAGLTPDRLVRPSIWDAIRRFLAQHQPAVALDAEAAQAITNIEVRGHDDET